MLNEKQIYNRMNRCYENHLEGNNAYYLNTDEWYGSTDPTIWVFYRPSEDKTYRMELDCETKDIRIAIKEGVMPYFDIDEAMRSFKVSNGNY
jgi:hypothetical protein